MSLLLLKQKNEKADRWRLKEDLAEEYVGKPPFSCAVQREVMLFAEVLIISCSGLVELIEYNRPQKIRRLKE